MSKSIVFQETKIFSLSKDASLLLPFFETGVSAGFPSPASDFLETKIDLNKVLIRKDSTTFVVRAKGRSMEGAGIYDNDLLIVDKSLEPRDGKIAVCVIDGEFVLKRLKVDRTDVWLIPENENFNPIKITEENNFQIWGMLTFSIRQHIK